MLMQAGLVAGAVVLVAFVIWRLARTTSGADAPVDLGNVSQRWLAEQQATTKD
jgi:hypothetical protein